MAGPPTGNPRPGLVTSPTPSPLSSSSPGSPRHETRAVRCAPSVTSGSSPASLTTTTSAHAPPRSHRSTSNSTRRSAPLPGSFTSTRVCGSPLTSAFMAALAAAAAQVPVVQPVLRLSPLTFSMLGGMDGSRSLRGGIGSLLRFAKHVRELGAIEVGTRPAGTETGTHQDQSLPRKAGLPDPGGEVFEAALDDPLVGPARPVDHGARGLRRVSAFQQFFLQDARLCGGEEDGHGRSVLREALYVLAPRHGGAPRAAREDHRLGNLRHRQLATDGRRCRAQRGNSGRYLPAEANFLANLDLLHHSPVQARVPGMYAGDFQVLVYSPLVEFAHTFEWYGRRLNDLGVRSSVFEDIFVYEASGPDHHVRLPDELAAPDRQEIRGPRPSPYKPHLTQAPNLH